jgi:hypothetical protein
MTRMVDLDRLSASDLEHLAAIKREQERRQAEQHTAQLAERLWDKPTIGWYRRQRAEQVR